MRSGITLALLALLLTACGDESGPAAPPGPSAVEIPSWAQVAPEQIAEAKKHGVPVAFENHLGMRFVLIPAGTFLMGSPPHEEGRDNDEGRQTVQVSVPYYVQTTEVTNANFRRWRPDHYGGTESALTMNADAQPVRIEFRAALGFTAWLSEEDAVRHYRLPTEPEWEYACRGGTTGPYYWGTSLAEAHRYENHFGFLLEPRRDPKGYPMPDRDGQQVPAPVASFLPNPWGLHDMLGNVAEWCGDYYAENRWYWTDEAVPVLDPVSPGATEARVVRGSYCLSTLNKLRCAYRDGYYPLHERAIAGFRLVSPLPEKAE